MTRLKGPKGTPSWLWIVVALLLIVGLLLGLDYLDILQLGLY